MSEATANVIEMRNVTKKWGEKIGVQNITFEMPATQIRCRA